MDSLGPRTVSSYQSDGINTRKPARSRPFCELWPVHVSPCNLALKRRGTGPRAYLLEGGGLRRRNASIVDKKTDDRRKYAFRDKHTVPIERRRSHHLESGDVTHDSAALSIRSQERPQPSHNTCWFCPNIAYLWAGVLGSIAIPSATDLEAQRADQTSGPPRQFHGENDGKEPNERWERKGAEYEDPSAAYWELYMSEAEINDENLINGLGGDADTMSIVNTIFSTIVGSFIIELYKTLQSPTGQPQASFKPSSIAIRMNIVMFLSLILSTMSVVVCALVKQWCREFKTYAYPCAPPHKRGRVRAYLYHGLERSQMRRFMYGVHVALHISVFLFFWAVSDFLYNVYQPVGNVARYCLLTSLAVYTAFSISPLVFINSPYHTALTPPLRGCGALVFLILLILLRFIPRFWEHSCSWARYFEGIRFHRTHFLVDQANERREELDRTAMKWLLTDDDLSDTNMDTFLQTLPGYIHSRFTKKECLQEQLTAEYIIERIEEHFLTCATSHGLSEDACIARVSACVNSLRLIFKPAGEKPDNLGKLREGYIQDLIKNLNEQCEDKDSRVALRASCVRVLAFQGLLMHLTPSDREKIPDQTFPPHLSPLYRFVRENRETSAHE